jgi:hypothetical protein
MPPLTPEQLKRFDEASNHPFECNCEICREWWSLMLPPAEHEEPDEDTPAF